LVRAASRHLHVGLSLQNRADFEPPDPAAEFT